MTEDGLVVDFVDERYEVEPGEELTFGRAATVVLDEGNEFLSRVVGAFVFHEGSWWLQNRSSSTQVTVVAPSGQQAVLPPGTSDPLTAGTGRIRFRAGRPNYELHFELTDPPSGPRPPGPVDRAARTGEAKATADFGVIPLNGEQRAMLALFARDRLLDPTSDAAPPQNAEVANRLGWSLKKLDRKLDYLCARLSDAGVPGLRGERGGEAADRRRRLIDHVIDAKLISTDDLPPGA